MSTLVSGQTVEANVGELIRLTPAYKSNWGTLKSAEWTIPGEIVKFYVGSNRGSAKVTKMKPEDLKKTRIFFYWIDGGTPAERKVEAKCVYTSAGKDQEVTLHINYKVWRPTAKFTSQTGVVGVYDGPRLGYGSSRPSIALPGIVWCGEVKTGPKGKGQLKLVQLINGRRWFTMASGTTWEIAQPTGRFDLDESNPYDSPVNVGNNSDAFITSNDSPSSLIHDLSLMTGDKDRTRTKQFAAHDRFQVWLMYRPESPFKPIWVPLSKIKWSWQGTAVRDSSARLGWSLRSSSAEQNPSGIKTTRVEDIPEWDYVSKEGKKYVKK